MISCWHSRQVWFSRKIQNSFCSLKIYEPKNKKKLKKLVKYARACNNFAYCPLKLTQARSDSNLFWSLFAFFQFVENRIACEPVPKNSFIFCGEKKEYSKISWNISGVPSPSFEEIIHGIIVYKQTSEKIIWDSHTAIKNQRLFGQKILSSKSKNKVKKKRYSKYLTNMWCLREKVLYARKRKQNKQLKFLVFCRKTDPTRWRRAFWFKFY